MAEYIEREAALAAINALRGPHAMPKICIEKIPAADVAEVRHGRWEINPDGYYPYCSGCRNEPENGVMSKFCPNCGAKMDGAKPETGEEEKDAEDIRRQQ